MKEEISFISLSDIPFRESEKNLDILMILSINSFCIPSFDGSV